MMRSGNAVHDLKVNHQLRVDEQKVSMRIRIEEVAAADLIAVEQGENI